MAETAVGQQEQTLNWTPAGTSGGQKVMVCVFHPWPFKIKIKLNEKYSKLLQVMSLCLLGTQTTGFLITQTTCRSSDVTGMAPGAGDAGAKDTGTPTP